MRMRNLPEYPSARARQLRDSLSTASMRSATARESTRHTARSTVAPGNGIKRSTTLRTYHPQRKPAFIDLRHTRRYAGEPAAGAGSRSTSCGTGSSWADDEGSATVGAADDGCADGVGSGGGGVRVGVGCGAAVVGAPGFALVPGLGGAEADGLTAPGADGEAEPEADSPGLGLPCPCFPSPAEPPNPSPPPGAPEPPSGTSPACRPAECEGLAPPPASSPTLIQPAAAATTATAATRRTGTYMGRTGPPPRAKRESPLNSRRPPEDTHRTAPPRFPTRRRPVPDLFPSPHRPRIAATASATTPTPLQLI